LYWGWKASLFAEQDRHQTEGKEKRTLLTNTAKETDNGASKKEAKPEWTKHLWKLARKEKKQGETTATKRGKKVTVSLSATEMREMALIGKKCYLARFDRFETVGISLLLETNLEGKEKKRWLVGAVRGEKGKKKKKNDVQRGTWTMRTKKEETNCPTNVYSVNR